MNGIEDISRAIRESGKEREFDAIAASPEGKKVGSMVDTQKAQRAVQDGDTAALKEILQQVLQTEDGRALAERLGNMLGK
jgi:phosphopantetheine adenylyltransferase